MSIGGHSTGKMPVDGMGDGDDQCVANAGY